ncbi:MAG: hypothetical protein JWO32_3048 [Bacteroidetes bacterium]|nr:hypothetical protein [Bacteroidota bacterium]
MKPVFKIILFLLLIGFYPQNVHAQDKMFKQKKERKRIWRKWRKNREAYNPYVDAKAKDKPSAKMARKNKKELKRQKRTAKKELRKNKKKFGTQD